LDQKEYDLMLVDLHSVARVELIIKIMEPMFIAAIIIVQLIIMELKVRLVLSYLILKASLQLAEEHKLSFQLSLL
jgi:hypothetical protein